VRTRGRLVRRLLAPAALALAGWAASTVGASTGVLSLAGAPRPAAPAVPGAQAGHPAVEPPPWLDEEALGTATPWPEPSTAWAPWTAARPGPPARPVWTPPTPLPADDGSPRHVDLVFTPHPDDETLSLGVWIANAAARGDRVIVVALSDGRSTGALPKVEARLGRPVSRDEIAAARLRELRAAATALGVAPADVYPARLDAEGSPGGSRVTEPEAAAVIQAFAERFPDATSATMSWVAEMHPDHLSAGRALWRAVRDGSVHDAVFAVSRLWWALPGPVETPVLPASAVVRERVLAAAADYDLWDPAEQRYAVGRTSVPPQFEALAADPRDRIHHWASARPPLKAW